MASDDWLVIKSSLCTSRAGPHNNEGLDIFTNFCNVIKTILVKIVRCTFCEFKLCEQEMVEFFVRTGFCIHVHHILLHGKLFSMPSLNDYFKVQTHNHMHKPF